MRRWFTRASSKGTPPIFEGSHLETAPAACFCLRNDPNSFDAWLSCFSRCLSSATCECLSGRVGTICWSMLNRRLFEQPPLVSPFTFFWLLKTIQTLFSRPFSSLLCQVPTLICLLQGGSKANPVVERVLHDLWSVCLQYSRADSTPPTQIRTWTLWRRSFSGSIQKKRNSFGLCRPLRRF